MEENKDIKEGIKKVLEQEQQTIEIMQSILRSLENEGQLPSEALPKDDVNYEKTLRIEKDMIRSYVDQYIQKRELSSEKIRSKNPYVADLAKEMEIKKLSSKSFEEYNNELVSLEEKEAQLKDHENAKETSEEGK